MYEGAYYLTKIDDKWRRFYAVKGQPQQPQPTQQGVQSAKTSAVDLSDEHLTSRTAIRLNAVNN